MPGHVQTRQRRGGPRPAAFLVVAAVFSFVFAYGRYGADVGAAIALPLGAAVAAALLAGRRRLALLAFALPIPALAILSAADLLTGANAHLTRTVLDAESGGDVLAVFGHRLQRDGRAASPGRSSSPACRSSSPPRRSPGCAATASPPGCAGLPAMRAGLLGALAATLVGTLANDSGALLLEIGAAYLLVFVGFAWAESERPGCDPGHRLGLTLRANRPSLAIFLELPGRREPARRGARRGVPRSRPSRARARPLRSPRPAQPGASPCAGGGAGDPRLPRADGSHGRVLRQRRGLQPRSLPGRRCRRPPPRASPGPLRRGPHPRAGRAAGRLERGTRGPRAGGRHLPRLLDQGDPQPHRLGAGRAAGLNRLSARIAVSEAAAWTGRRWFGGRYEVVPNGVDVDAAPPGPKPPSDELRVLFVGRPEERKGLPVLLTAFEALVEHVPSRLTVIGAEREDVLRYLADPEAMRWIDVRGRVSGESLWTALHEADLLCAPSLSGESFGMVLTEAFAAGTPAIASAIAGYSDVVTDGVDGVLVPPGDPQRLAEELQRAHHEPERLAAMGEAARQSAQRYAWPRVADRVSEVYERAIEAPPPSSAVERAAHWAGLRPADGAPPSPPRRLPSLDPPLAQSGSRKRRIARRAGLGVAGALGVGLTALAAQKIGVDNVIASIVRSDLTWVAGRLRADGPLALLPRRLLVRDRARGAAQPAGAPPRRHLGDDDRRADVGDAAGTPRRAGPGDDPGAADRAHARDLPGAARDARLADAAQHRRPGPARRDHRLDHRPLPLQHREAVRLQLRAAGAAARRPGRARC